MGGLPSLVPWALARSKPINTRSFISDRSNSATDAITVKTIFPMGVLVSTASLSEIKSTSKALNSSRAITRWRTLLENLSNLATATAENLSLRAAIINRSS